MGLLGRIIKGIFGPKDPDPVALVLLLSNPRELPELIVRQAIEAGTGSPVRTEDLQSEPLRFEWKSEGWKITFLSLPTRYIPEGGPAMSEARIQAAVEAHTGAILIDVWEAPAGKDRATDGINVVGKMALPLIDADVTAVYCFNTQRMNLVTEELLTAFAEGQASEVMNTVAYDAVISQYDEKSMEAAIEEARRRFPEFEDALRSRVSPEQLFMVKLPFGEGDRVENMWVGVTSIEGGKVTGKLENKPMHQPGLRLGSVVSQPVEDVCDWIYLDGQDFVGGFTNEVLQG